MSTYRKDLFTQIALVGKSFGNGNRLELLEILAQGEHSVDNLAKIAGLKLANVSQHLQGLRRAGLVAVRTDGQKSFYRLSDDSVIGIVNLLRGIAEKNIGEINRLVDSYLKTKDELEPISRAELLKKVEKGTVTVVDVRPEEEYGSGHVPHAINIPLSKLKKELNKIPKKKEVIAYCRGPFCIWAYDAVNQLRSKGYKARRLEDGFPEWKYEGRPVELSK